MQTGNYSLVLLIQLTLLAYDLFVNSFSELLRGAPVIQLVLFIIQDIAILFNVIIILLMMFNTYVFQVGLVSLLLERFRALLIISALYLTLSICFHCWVLNLRWLESNRFVWTDGLQALFAFQRTGNWWINSEQYCITTYTNAQQSIWETRGCMRTLCGCVMPLPELVSEGATSLRDI
uniref:transmembrane protein 138 isoform X2 n=1 Tax=Scatophagus argus TaxID=75038 RepID=UPI001ED85D63|nr:transmembrane protein 138 isoform X2 [Scatophagus argus]